MIGLLVLLLGLTACAPSPRPGTAPATSSATASSDTTRPDWARFFEAEGAVGTFVLFETTTGRTMRHDPARASTRLTPASTSKVWNALVFLASGVVTDVDSLYAWDGVERQIGSWNRDHSLRSGMKVSAVWVFQRLAVEVGRERYDVAFAVQPYGNSTMGEPLQMAWLDGSLRISADEQVAFLDGLRRGILAFTDADQATVRDILPVLADDGRQRLKAKTGWGLRDGEPDIGWIVGWVERPGGDAVFAMNAEAAPGETFDMGPGRLRIVRSILEAEGWLSPEGDPGP